MTDSVFIIAEAGVNHGGELDQALLLVDAAADAGADAVKFQTFKAAELVTANAAKASYQITNTRDAGSQLAMLKGLELSHADHVRLVSRCRERNILFMSTAFDPASLVLLSTFDVPALKIASGDITAGRLLLQTARLRRLMIVSTGMATLGDIERALGVIAFGLVSSAEPRGSADFAAAYQSAEGQSALRATVRLLHCTTEYPAPPASINLLAMDTMRAAFGLPVGYSDHTMGIVVAIAAVARGASVIEKHLTLDRTLPGPDHAASLEPIEFARLVEAIRTTEIALGLPLKGPQPDEIANRVVARRSLVAARDVQKGEIFAPGLLDEKRPGVGRSPLDYWDVLGRPAGRDYAKDEALDV